MQTNYYEFQLSCVITSLNAADRPALADISRRQCKYEASLSSISWSVCWTSYEASTQVEPAFGSVANRRPDATSREHLAALHTIFKHFVCAVV